MLRILLESTKVMLSSMTLLSSLNRWKNVCQEALDLKRSNGGERTESKSRKDEDHGLWDRPGPLAEFR